MFNRYLKFVVVISIAGMASISSANEYCNRVMSGSLEAVSAKGSLTKILDRQQKVLVSLCGEENEFQKTMDIQQIALGLPSDQSYSRYSTKRVFVLNTKKIMNRNGGFNYVWNAGQIEQGKVVEGGLFATLRQTFDSEYNAYTWNLTLIEKDSLGKEVGKISLQGSPSRKSYGSFSQDLN